MRALDQYNVYAIDINCRAKKNIIPRTTTDSLTKRETNEDDDGNIVAVQHIYSSVTEMTRKVNGGKIGSIVKHNRNKLYLLQ